MMKENQNTESLGEGVQKIDLDDVKLELRVLGAAGPPLLFLHSGESPSLPSDAYLRELAGTFRVFAPWHPGFGHGERPTSLKDIGDLAYFYLDLVDALGLDRPILAGASFGGWIAAEMAIRSPATFAQLVLIAPLGIKVHDRNSRDIADIFAMADEEFLDAAYADPFRGALDLSSLDDADLAAYFRGRESLAYFGWKPYMHNPRLKRWLHRARLPALVLAGERDAITCGGYHRAFADSLPDSVLRVIADAGHLPHIEQPSETTREIVRFHETHRLSASAA